MTKPPLRISSSNRGEGLNEVEQIDPVILLKVIISLLSGA